MAFEMDQKLPMFPFFLLNGIVIDHPAPLARDAAVSRNILRGRLDF